MCQDNKNKLKNHSIKKKEQIQSIKISLSEREEEMVLEQIKYLQNEYVSIQQGFLTVISIPLGVYALLIYYTVNVEHDKIREILFLLLPFFFCLSIYNILKYTIKALGLDSYIRHLERILNKSRRKPLFLWQSLFIYANGYSVLGFIGQMPCILVIFLYLSYNFFLTAIKTTVAPKVAISVLMILYICQLIMLLIMLLHCGLQYFAIEQTCDKVLENYLDKETWENYENIDTRMPIYLKNINIGLIKALEFIRDSYKKH